jgi:hypothetical protein
MIRSDALLKFHLNVHLMDTLFDEESIRFELIRYCIEQSKKSKSGLDLSEIKFTTATLKYIFKDLEKNSSLKEEIIRVLKKMVSSGEIEPNGKTLYIKRTTIDQYFTFE